MQNFLGRRGEAKFFGKKEGKRLGMGGCRGDAEEMFVLQTRIGRFGVVKHILWKRSVGVILKRLN